jgi:hypothetical protein
MSHEEQIESDNGLFNCDNGSKATHHQSGGNAALGGEFGSFTKEEVRMLRTLLLRETPSPP